MYTFDTVTEAADKAVLFRRMEAEGLLGCAMYAVKPSLHIFLESCCSGVVVTGFSGGEMTGFALFSPWMGRAWRFDFTVFRACFRQAPTLSRALLRWFFERYAADAVVGITPMTNRHAWHLAGVAGFTVLGTIPRACYIERRHTFVAGVLVMATPETVEGKSMGFSGGGASAPTPVVQEVPKAETTKDVTAATTEARQSQKDKAAKAAGLKNTVLSDALTASGTTAGTAKTLLGQ